MDIEHRYFRRIVGATLLVAYTFGGAASAFAQVGPDPATDKWRPKDGPYASPGKGFDSQCGEYGDIILELSKKSVSGNEWGCKVTKRSNTAPDAIRLNMTCNDYNLAEALYPTDPKAEEKTFEEILILKKIGDRSIAVRKTTNGKFKESFWRADYCPESFQRMYTEAQARNKAEAERKTAEAHPWRPQAGVYAIPGANFNDRCQQAGDAIIDLEKRSIASGNDKCDVNFVRDNPENIQLFATCTTPPVSTALILKKIDDKTVSLQKSKDANFSDPEQTLAYCGPDVQTTYRQQKAQQ